MISKLFAYQNATSVQQPWSKKQIALGVFAYCIISSQFTTFQNISSKHTEPVSSNLSGEYQDRDAVAPDASHFLPGMSLPKTRQQPDAYGDEPKTALQLTPAFKSIDHTISKVPEPGAGTHQQHQSSGTDWISLASTLFSLGLILYVRRRMSQYAAKQTSKGFSWLGQQVAGLAKSAKAAATEMSSKVPANVKPAAATASAAYSATVSGTARPASTMSVSRPAAVRKTTAPPRKSVVSRR